MPFDDRQLLRLHVQAVWNIQLPSIIANDVNVLTNSKQPPWLLYSAQLAHERINIWHSDVDHPMYQALLALTEKASTYPIETDKYVIEREVAFTFTGQSRISLAQAQQLAGPITADKQPLVAAFQPGAAHYFFEYSRKPLYGTILNERLLSIAHSSRRTTEACELGIETLPEARRKAYALASTILWTHEVLQEGLVPIYSALAQNTASLALAEAAGYRIFVRGINIARMP